MEPYIKKSDIVAEIEKYISNYKGILNKVDKSSYNWLDSAMSLESKIDVLQHLLSFLDTVEVKEVEVPVSKDLEEASYNFVMNNFGNPKEPLYKFDQRCFKAGAQWQKQQLIDKACEWQRQHMKTLPELLNKDFTKHTLWKRDEIIDKFRQAMEE